ncbi:MAG: undecaprenyl-diphosphate phosphatase [Egibacteraceae bacterium]
MVPFWLQALVLGVVQGLTEFVPVSSSAHLVLVPYLLGWQQPTLAFDVALHMGTLAAVLCYFRRELWAMAVAVTRRAQEAEGRLYRQLALLLVLASVPVAIVGALLERWIAAVFQAPGVTAALLFVTAAILAIGEKIRDRRVGRTLATTNADGDGTLVGGAAQSGAAKALTATRLRGLPVGRDDHDPAGATLAELGVRQAVTVGLMQVVALLPGVSRSGSTITGGIASGLTREAATRFSFLLSIPALIGAGMLGLADLAQPDPFGAIDIAIGLLAAFVAGYLAIRWLVALVAHARLTGFAWYCAAAGAVGLLGYLMLGPPP